MLLISVITALALEPMASHSLGQCPPSELYSSPHMESSNALKEGEVCSYCLQGVGEEVGHGGSQFCSSSAPTSGCACEATLALCLRLYVQISKLELNAELFLPKG